MSVRINKDQFFSVESGIATLKKNDAAVNKNVIGALKVGSASIEVGNQVSIGDLGSILSYRVKRFDGEYRVSPYYSFGESGTVDEGRQPILIGDSNIDITNNDGSVNHDAVLTGGVYCLNSTITIDKNFLVWRQILKVGDTNPTEPVLFEVYEDSTCTTETKILFNIWLPISLWSGKTAGDTIEFYLAGSEDKETPISGFSGLEYCTHYESDAPFSLYGDSTQIMDKVIGQEFSYLNSAYDNNVEISADYTHASNARYFVDTTSNTVTITILDGNEYSFVVSDSNKNFNTNSCTISIKDSGGTVIHTAELDKKNKSYLFFYDGTNWNYAEDGKGEVIAIASTHVASTDFPYTDEQSDWDATDGDMFIQNKPTDITDLSLHDATELDDITSSGSGSIMTSDERTKLTAIKTPACAAGYFTTGVCTEVCSSGTYYKVNATFTPSTGGEECLEWDSTNKRWNYTSTTSRDVSIFMTFTAEHDDGSTRDITYKVYINGSAVSTAPSHAEVEQYDSMNMALMCPIVTLAEDDYVELYVTMDSSGDEVTTSNMNMLIR